MLSVSHVATGAVIATKISNPWLSIPLILVTHYLEDTIPHWDAGTGLGNGSKSRRAAFFHELPDLLASLLLLLVFFPFSSTPYWGAFLALLPDFLEFPRNFLHWEPRFLAPINRFHRSFHHSIPRVLDGLAPQILLFILLWLAR